MFKTVWVECILINFSITDPLLYFLKEICRSQKFIRSAWSRSGIRYQVCCLNHVRWSKCFFLIDEPVNTKLFECSLLLHLLETLTHPLKKWPRFLRVTCNNGNFTFGCPTENWSLDSIKCFSLKSCFKLGTSKIGPPESFVTYENCNPQMQSLIFFPFFLGMFLLHWLLWSCTGLILTWIRNWVVIFFKCVWVCGAAKYSKELTGRICRKG